MRYFKSEEPFSSLPYVAKSSGLNNGRKNIVRRFVNNYTELFLWNQFFMTSRIPGEKNVQKL